MAAEFDPALAEELLQRYDDPASAQFDAVLAAAGLDPATARALRFWQRESVAGVKHYAAQALPGVVAALAAAEAETRAAVERAAAAWDEVQPGDRREPGLVVVPPETRGWLPPDPSLPGSAEADRRTVSARLTRLG